MLNLKEKVILGSGSPRRKALLGEIVSDFEVKVSDVDEFYPEDLPLDQIAVFLAELKANAIGIKDGELLITSDTVVRNQKRIFEKPQSREEAYEFLKALQGKSHFVDTAVCIQSLTKKKSFTVSSEVVFNNLDDEEIYYYIDKYKPFDKAGAYGIQEWIGYIAVNKINGDYQAIVGFPISAIYQTLKAW